MAKEVSFVIKLDDKGTFKKVTMDAEELGKAVRSVQDESEKVKRNIISWAEASQAVGALQDVIGELQGVMQDLTEAYQVQLVAETQLQTIMRQRMGATDEMIQNVKDLCSAQQELGVIGDEVQLSGAQQMATFLKSKQSLDVLIPAMNNLIAQQNGLNATNQDAVSIGNMMGKAMQGQVEVLQRVGITFDESQKKVLQFGTESERAAMLAQVITDNVGNMNAELAKTDAGKQKQLENTMGDYKEVLGQVIQKYSRFITVAAASSTLITNAGKLYTSFMSVSTALDIARRAGVLWNATSVRMNALVTVCSATMRGAAVSATTLKLAIQGLLISTGVGIAIVALTEGIGALIGSCDDAAASVDRLSDAEQRAKQAAERVQSAYDDTYQQTLASLKAKYEQLKGSWESLKNTHEKTEWIKKNKGAFDELRIKVNDITDAENVFTKNTDKVAEAFERRAKAAAYAAELVELYKQQLDLKNRKENVDKTILEVTNKYNHSNQTDNRDNPYATENTRRAAGIAGIAADLKKGGDGNISKLNKQLDATNKKIEETKKKLRELGGNEVIDYGSNGGSGGGTPHETTTPAPHTDKTDEKKALQGSIDWYEEKIRELQTQMQATPSLIDRKKLNQEIEGLQRQLRMVKIQAGIEKIPSIEVKKNISKPISEQIKEDIEKLKIKPIHVKTKVETDAEDFEKLSSLFSIDTTNFQSVLDALKKIKDISKPTAKGFATAGVACQALGSSLQQLGADSAAAKAGMVMAAIGQIVLSFAQALSTCRTWVTWLAFGITGTAQLTSLIATISKFATGGIVGGNQTSGDNVLVRVNSGEMILNAAQQARLFALANGAAVQGVSVNAGTLRGVTAAGGVGDGQLVGKIRGRDIVIAVANETRSNRRRSNIKI